MITIKEPYWSAGQRYGWSGDRVGFGVKLSDLVGDGDLRIIVKDKPEIYTINKSKARDLVKLYNSVYIARGVGLGVLPRQEFCCHGTK